MQDGAVRRGHEVFIGVSRCPLDAGTSYGRWAEDVSIPAGKIPDCLASRPSDADARASRISEPWLGRYVESVCRPISRLTSSPAMGQPSTCATARCKPAWAAETTSWTPPRPRSTSECRKAAPEGLGLPRRHRGDRFPVADSCTRRRARAPSGHMASFSLSPLRVEPQVRVAALERPAR